MNLPSPLDWPGAGIGSGPDIPPERRVTRDNWRSYPWSRWAFQHTRELVPSRAVPRCDSARRLVEEPVELSGLMFPDGDGGTIAWPAFLDRTYTDALLILHRGRLVHEHYANGMTARTPHMLFSITKSVVGLVAERLIMEGLFDPSAQVADHVPELARSGFGSASARHLLDMVDGVAFDEDYARPDAEVHSYSAAYWTSAAGHEGVLGMLPKLIRRDAEPGQAFRYRTPVADVLGLLLRRVTGRPLATLIGEHVWRPAGCADDCHMLVDTAGLEIAGTGLNATARDLARLALWLMEPEQRPLLGVLMMGGDRALFAAARMTTRPHGSYRGFWWIDHGETPSLSALGVFGQRLWLAPAEELAVIRFGSHPIASNSFTDIIHRNAFAALRATLG